MWALPSCTFAQLQGEASRHWQLSPADTVLQDDSGVPWPAEGRVLETVLARMGVKGAAPGAAGVSLESFEVGSGSGDEGSCSGSEGGPDGSDVDVAGGGRAARKPRLPRFILRMRHRALEQLMDIPQPQARGSDAHHHGSGAQHGHRGGPSGDDELSNEEALDARLGGGRPRVRSATATSGRGGGSQLRRGHSGSSSGGDGSGGRNGSAGVLRSHSMRAALPVRAAVGDGLPDGDWGEELGDDAGGEDADEEAEAVEVMAALDPFFSPTSMPCAGSRLHMAGGRVHARGASSSSHTLPRGRLSSHPTAGRPSLGSAGQRGVVDGGVDGLADFATDSEGGSQAGVEGDGEGEYADDDGHGEGDGRGWRHGGHGAAPARFPASSLTRLSLPASSLRTMMGDGAHGGEGGGDGFVVLPPAGQLRSPLSSKLAAQLAAATGGGHEDALALPMVIAAPTGLPPPTTVPPDSLFFATPLGHFAAVEPRLWRIFTWYAVAGDASDPFHIRARQWRCLLDDCGLLSSGGLGGGGGGGGVSASVKPVRVLGAPPTPTAHDGSITPQVADLLFARATGGGKAAVVARGPAVKPAANMTMAEASAARAAADARRREMATMPAVGMDYLQFLRALIAIAVKRAGLAPAAATPAGGSTSTAATNTASAGPVTGGGGGGSSGSGSGSTTSINPMLVPVTLPPLPADVVLNVATHAGTMAALKTLLSVTTPVYLSEGVVDKLVDAAVARSRLSSAATSPARRGGVPTAMPPPPLPIPAGLTAVAANPVNHAMSHLDGAYVPAVLPRAEGDAPYGIAAAATVRMRATSRSRSRTRHGQTARPTDGSDDAVGSSSFVHVTMPREDVVTAFVTMVQMAVVPHARAWPIDAWRAETALMRIGGASADEGGGGGEPTSLAVVMHPFMTSLRLLFTYYAFHEAAAAGLPAFIARPASAGPVGRKARAQPHSAPSRLSIAATPHGTATHRGSVAAPADAVADGLVVTAVPPLAAGGLESATGVVEEGGGGSGDDVGSVAGSGAGGSYAARHRRSSVGSAGTARSGTTARTSSVRDAARPYSTTQMARLTLLRKSGVVVSGRAGDGTLLHDVTHREMSEEDARSVLRLPPSPSHLWQQGDASADALLSHPAWCRFVADMGLGRVGDVVLPARALTECFLASAGGASVLDAAARAVSRSTSRDRRPRDATSRIALSFAQFCDCLVRVSLRCGQPTTPASAAAVSGPRAPPAIALKALLQTLSNRLHDAHLVTITAARAEHCSVYPEPLLRGAAAFQKAFRAASATDGHADYVAFFNAFLRQLPAPAAAGSPDAGVPGARSGPGDVDSVTYATRVEALVEGGHHVTALADGPLSVMSPTAAGGSGGGVGFAVSSAPGATSHAPTAASRRVYGYRADGGAAPPVSSAQTGRLTATAHVAAPPVFASDRDRPRGVAPIAAGGSGGGSGAPRAAAAFAQQVNNLATATATATGTVASSTTGSAAGAEIRTASATTGRGASAWESLQALEALWRDQRKLQEVQQAVLAAKRAAATTSGPSARSPLHVTVSLAGGGDGTPRAAGGQQEALWQEVLRAREMAAAASKQAAAHQRALRLGLPIPADEAVGAEEGGTEGSGPSGSASGTVPSGGSSVVIGTTAQPSASPTPPILPGSGEAGPPVHGAADVTAQSSEQAAPAPAPPPPALPAGLLSPTSAARLTISSSRYAGGGGGGGGVPGVGGAMGVLPYGHPLAASHLRGASAFFMPGGVAGSDGNGGGGGGGYGHSRIHSMSFAPSISRLVEAEGFAMGHADGGGGKGVRTGSNATTGRDEPPGALGATVAERGRSVRASLHALAASNADSVHSGALADGRSAASGTTASPARRPGGHTDREGGYDHDVGGLNVAISPSAHLSPTDRTGTAAHHHTAVPAPPQPGRPPARPPCMERARSEADVLAPHRPSNIAPRESTASKGTLLGGEAAGNTAPANAGGTAGRAAGADARQSVAIAGTVASAPLSPQRSDATSTAPVSPQLHHAASAASQRSSGSAEGAGSAGQSPVGPVGDVFTPPAMTRKPSVHAGNSGGPTSAPSSGGGAPSGGGHAADGIATSPTPALQSLSSLRSLSNQHVAGGQGTAASTATGRRVSTARSHAADAHVDAFPAMGTTTTAVPAGGAPLDERPAHTSDRRISGVSVATAASSLQSGAPAVPPLPLGAGQSGAGVEGSGFHTSRTEHGAHAHADAAGSATAAGSIAGTRTGSRSSMSMTGLYRSPEKLLLSARSKTDGGAAAGGGSGGGGGGGVRAGSVPVPLASSQRPSFTTRNAFSPTLGAVAEGGGAAAGDGGRVGSGGPSALSTPASTPTRADSPLPPLHGEEDLDGRDGATATAASGRGHRRSGPLPGASGAATTTAATDASPADDSSPSPIAERPLGGHGRAGSGGSLAASGGGGGAEAGGRRTGGAARGVGSGGGEGADVGGGGRRSGGSGGGPPSPPLPVATSGSAAGGSGAGAVWSNVGGGDASHGDEATAGSGAVTVTVPHRRDSDSDADGATSTSRGAPTSAGSVGAAAGGGGEFSSAPLLTPGRLADIDTYRNKWKRLLCNGAVMRKYGRHGFPHDRRVVLTPDCRRLVWCAPGAKLDLTALPDGEGIRAGAVVAIVDGVSTPVFRKNAGWYKQPGLCFSLVAGDRTLDLEAPTPQAKDDWLTALLAWQRYRHLL